MFRDRVSEIWKPFKDLAEEFCHWFLLLESLLLLLRLLTRIFEHLLACLFCIVFMGRRRSRVSALPPKKQIYQIRVHTRLPHFFFVFLFVKLDPSRKTRIIWLTAMYVFFVWREQTISHKRRCSKTCPFFFLKVFWANRSREGIKFLEAGRARIIWVSSFPSPFRINLSGERKREGRDDFISLQVCYIRQTDIPRISSPRKKRSMLRKFEILPSRYLGKRRSFWVSISNASFTLKKPTLTATTHDLPKNQISFDKSRTRRSTVSPSPLFLFGIFLSSTHFPRNHRGFIKVGLRRERGIMNPDASASGGGGWFN